MLERIMGNHLKIKIKLKKKNPTLWVNPFHNKNLTSGAEIKYKQRGNQSLGISLAHSTM